MKNLSLRTSFIYYLVIVITLLVSLASTISPSFINTYGFYLVTFSIVGIGIPHGATDYLVFRYLSKGNTFVEGKLKFYSLYILAVLAFAISWYLFPTFSLIAFIIISIYHLGQSNLYYLSLPKNKMVETFIYSIWGLFVVGTPILSNYEKANKILDRLNIDWTINLENKKYLLALIILVNSLTFSSLFVLGYIAKTALLRESLNLSILGLLFYTTPLVVAFGVYFCFWHSLGSTLDQIRFIRRYNLSFNLIDFYLNSIPLTIISIVTFSLACLCLVCFNSQAIQANSNTTLGMFFVSLAAITLPHTIVRERLYGN